MKGDEESFEQPILELERRIEELSGYSDDSRRREVESLRGRLFDLRKDVFSHLTPWQKTMVARHPRRPYTLDYLEHLFTDFTEVHGDRKFADDPAIVSGFAFFRGRAVAVIGHQKGRDTKEKVLRNFAMPRPEGYRKSLRVMQIAEKFHRPVITFVDTPGAYPGIGAEERGQAEAIAMNLREMSRLRTPILVTITGEGGSGGALALAVGDRINMLEHSIYSVISPEGCAAILWRDAGMAKEAARALRLTTQDLLEFGLIDAVVPEPVGGAHTDVPGQAALLGDILARQIEEVCAQSMDDLLRDRYDKFRRMGRFAEAL